MMFIFSKIAMFAQNLKYKLLYFSPEIVIYDFDWITWNYFWVIFFYFF